MFVAVFFVANLQCIRAENFTAESAKEFLKKSTEYQFDENQDGDAYMKQYHNYKSIELGFNVTDKDKFNAGALGFWCLRMAAEKNVGHAQYIYAERIRNSLYSPDPVEATEWIAKAAKNGFSEAQYELGMKYYKGGDGVPKNDNEAFKWFQKAANQNNGKAQEMLGIYYGTGNVVEIDNVKAYIWYNLAVANGVDKALSRREHIAKSLSKSQLSEAQMRTSKWLENKP